jgi:hypothetical protein
VTCEEVLGSAAVALLTGDPVEADVASHLDVCESCEAELARLASLPGVLARLDPRDLQVLDTAEAAGPALLDRLLASASRDRRRRRRAGMLAVAAAAVLLVVVPLGAWGVTRLGQPGQSSAAPAPAQISRTATDASTGISGKVQVWASALGSVLDVSISGVPSGTRCTIVVVTKNGTSQTAASWQATYTGTAQVRVSVAAPVSSIARIDIVDDSGKVLLRI